MIGLHQLEETTYTITQWFFILCYLRESLLRYRDRSGLGVSTFKFTKFCLCVVMFLRYLLYGVPSHTTSRLLCIYRSICLVKFVGLLIILEHGPNDCVHERCRAKEEILSNEGQSWVWFTVSNLITVNVTKLMGRSNHKHLNNSSRVCFVTLNCQNDTLFWMEEERKKTTLLPPPVTPVKKGPH